MDSYIEYLVKKNKTFLDYILVFAIIFIGLVIFYFSAFLAIVPSLMLLIVIGVIYLAYKMLMRTNLEYEYLIVNNEMDIDKIIGKRIRKRIDTINLRRIDDFGFCDNDAMQKYAQNPKFKKIYACADKKYGCAYIAYSKENGNKLLFFTPNEEMVEFIQKVNPGKF